MSVPEAPLKPYLRRLLTDYGHLVDPAGTLADAKALLAPLGVAGWQAAEVLTVVRKGGQPLEPGEFAEAPASEVRNTLELPRPTERGTVVENHGDTIEARHTDTEINARIMNVADLVEVANIDLTRWEIAAHKVNTWSTVTKGDDGTPTVTRLWQVSASLRPRVIPLIPLDWPPPPVFVVPSEIRAPDDTRVAVVLPDMQIGFRWRDLDTGRPWLEPYHDRAAIDAALQAIARIQPDTVILIGDNLDFQALSTRWAFGDEARRTTATAIREYAWLLHRLREIAPTAEIVYMLGNHEARLTKFLDERAGELAGLVHPDGRAALCLRSLLGLDALQIATHAYPQPYWLWGRVEIEHGRAVRAGGGATAAAVLAKREHSVVYGHIHRAELAQRTVEGPTGRRQILAGSPGCLCRTDGVVPGSDRPDWQQGIGVLTLAPDGDEDLQLLRIQRGRLFLGGTAIQGRDYTEELVESTGATALRAA